VTLTGKAADGDGFAASYTFTVDTLPPRLLLSAPVHGSLFEKDGKLTVTGVTDAGARLTVTSDGTAMLADVAVEDAGSFDAATGVFAVTVEIPDPNGAAQRRITVTVADDVGNAETVTATVTRGALADFRMSPSSSATPRRRTATFRFPPRAQSTRFRSSASLQTACALSCPTTL